MRRVLLDTNVLVSGLLFGGRAREVIRAALRGELQLVTSEHLVRELEEVLVDKFAFSAAAAAAVRSQLALLAEIVTPYEVPRVCRDPDDDQVLAAAVTGFAELIVTGDDDLLSLKSHADVKIVALADFSPLA